MHPVSPAHHPSSSRPGAPPRSPDSFVLFGATGDLAWRMLFPSLFFLESEGLLPSGLTIVGAARSDMTDEAFISKVADCVRDRAGAYFSDAAWERFKARLRYAAVDAKDPASFQTLKRMLGGLSEIVFYLSTSPSLFGPICEALKAAKLINGHSRVVVEKPIGHDLASCRAVNDTLAASFSEDRIFRVDHYLGKEAVQNLLSLRFANTLFEPLWNKANIEHIQITVAETVGVEGRWDYYNNYGALRDMVQNHMLQLLCLVAMEPPANLDPDSVRSEKVKVLQALRPLVGRDVEKHAVRAQYAAGVADGGSVRGYLEEGAGAATDTETFVAILAHVDNWRWAGTPIYLRTGKRLPVRKSEIVIQFRDVPHSIFQGSDLMANRLIIRLQPEEEISLLIMNKTPSLNQGGMELKPLSLNLSLSNAFQEQRPRRIAYERLLLEALNNNQTLFVRRDEQEAAWRWIDEIQAAWSRLSIKPASYMAGAWGPSASIGLIERNGHSWSE
jgi:glucose-6-phosphate 1-dehydrogenase